MKFVKEKYSKKILFTLSGELNILQVGNERIKMEESSSSAIIDVTTENRIISEFPDEIKDNDGYNNLSLSLDNSLVNIKKF